MVIGAFSFSSQFLTTTKELYHAVDLPRLRHRCICFHQPWRINGQSQLVVFGAKGHDVCTGRCRSSLCLSAIHRTLYLQEETMIVIHDFKEAYAVELRLKLTHFPQ